MDYESLKNLWQVVANFRNEQREKRYSEERRRESRLPAHGPACIYWEVEGEGWRSQAVSLLGISEHGCSFRTREPFAPDQTICLERADDMLEVFEAVVRHSAPDGDEYMVGAEIISRVEKPLERTEEPKPAVTEPSDHKS